MLLEFKIQRKKKLDKKKIRSEILNCVRICRCRAATRWRNKTAWASNGSCWQPECLQRISKKSSELNKNILSHYCTVHIKNPRLAVVLHWLYCPFTKRAKLPQLKGFQTLAMLQFNQLSKYTNTAFVSPHRLIDATLQENVSILDSSLVLSKQTGI